MMGPGKKNIKFIATTRAPFSDPLFKLDEQEYTFDHNFCYLF